jgi:MFS transporter, OPA family, glycerol-3-phosphate transporter
MRWTRWQLITIASLTIGYAGYYVCRSNLSVASPLLQADGFTKAEIGSIASAGVLTYAVGKIVNGVAGDYLGGRLMFLLALLGSIGATVAFGLASGLAAFTVIWCVNRFVQSAGWGAAMKITGHWFSPETYGRAVAVLCLSYLFGDAAARLILGDIIKRGASWQHLFFIAAGILAAIGVVIVFTLRNRPEDVGLPGVAGAAQSVFAEEGDQSRPDSLAHHLRAFAASPAFWVVCIMSFGLTLIRETFNTWTPTYLVEAASLTKDQAAKASALFPFFGGVSVLACGFLSDRVAKGRRAAIMLAFLAPGAITMVALGSLDESMPTSLRLALLSLVGFFIIGPYSFLSGAISLDMGSKRGVATAAGLIDAVGYLAGVLSGRYIGSLAQERGWSIALTALAGIAVLTAFAAAFYWFVHERERRSQ